MKGLLTKIQANALLEECTDMLQKACPDKGIAISEKAEAPGNCRIQVAAWLKKSSKFIEEEDLPEFRDYMKAFFKRQKPQPYHLSLDLTKEDDARVVVVGDIHCDYNSLSGIIQKLLLSGYDYFSRAYFVFMGDYLDRGSLLFESLVLLTGLKDILGERCIFLKGNHELIGYDSDEQKLFSLVYPSDSCPILNQYCCADQEFLEQFAGYFSGLPYYLLLKTKKGTDLLVHGGIPRDEFLDTCRFEDDGTIVEPDDKLRVQEILDNMIWSDPRPDPFKMQGPSSRFEFGKKQFLKFMDNLGYNRLLRSHEPVQDGVESFYNDRLFTVFSNGGVGNEWTGYPFVINPVFAILSSDGDIRFESIHFKRVQIAKGGYSKMENVLYQDKIPADKITTQPKDLHIDSEFNITINL